MLVLTALLLSVSSCLDNVVVGIAYGIKKIKIGIMSKIVIASVTTAGTYLSMSFGSYISQFLSTKAASLVGAGITGALGLYFVVQNIIKLVHHKKMKDLALKDVEEMMDFAEKSDADHSGDIGKSEAILLAAGLALNNLANGVAASIAHVNTYLTMGFTFFISIFAIYLGVGIGQNTIGKLFGKFAPLTAGVLLIALSLIKIMSS